MEDDNSQPVGISTHCLLHISLHAGFISGSGIAAAEAQKEPEYSALGAGNERVDMVQHAANLWRRRDQNPHLHRRPVEEKGGRNHRRPYIRPLQQIHKPLSLLTHAIRHAVNTTTTSAASMFGAAPPTPAHKAVAGNGVQRSTEARWTGCGSCSSGSEKSARGVQSAASVKAPRSVCFASSTEGGQDPALDDTLKSQPVAEGQASLSEDPASTTVPVPDRIAGEPAECIWTASIRQYDASMQVRSP